jgi:vancomycin resistance protein YoaR
MSDGVRGTHFMPDRQSSSGEVTTRPEPAAPSFTAEPNGAVDANGATLPNGAAVAKGATAEAQPEPAAVNAEDGPPAHGEATTEAAVERTDEVAATEPAAVDEPGPAALDRDTTEVAAAPAAGDRPCPAAAPVPPQAAAGAESAATDPGPLPPAVAEPPHPPAPAPRPRPQPGPAPDAEPTVSLPAGGDESPTVAVRRPSDDRPVWFEAPDAEAPDTETTQVIPGQAEGHSGPGASAEGSPAGPPVSADPPTQRIPLPPRPASDGTVVTAAPAAASEAEAPRPRKAKRRLLVLAGVVAVLGIAYGADLLLSSGSVTRGTTMAGVLVGGLSPAAAEQSLREQIEPRTTRPVAVTVGEARSQLDPRVAGLAVDWSATLDRAGAQPLNPITRVTSFFTSREVGVATSTDRTALDAALAQLAPIVDKVPVEGTVKFEGVTPVAVDPVPGQKLDAPGAATVLERDWASGGTIALPLTTLPSVTTPDDVAEAIAKVATPAVASPVTVLGENGAQGTLRPEVIAAALTFRPEPTGLVPAINNGAVTDALKPQLAASEKPGRDAKLDFSTGTPVVVPSQDGRGIDYPATLKDLLPVLTGAGKREITAVYADQPAKLTTEQLNGLGISGVIGEFQTGGFATDSGRNIKRAAEQINGAIVQPGETFSLNALTNPRDASNGYVEAGIIENGHAARGVGGGVSQVATTVYNAAYFAGMTNVEHKEHSFYISRYPPGREATVFDNIIDLKFRNDNPTAVMIQTAWTPSSLTVKIYGTKVWEVTSAAGPRTNPTSPNTITIPKAEKCIASKGAPGFTITNTRTLKNVQTGEVRSDPTRTVKYNPSPIVVCGP